MKKTLYSYLEKISKDIFDAPKQENSDILLSCINEIQKIRISLTSKGIKYNSIKNIFLMVKILIPNLLKKVNDIESSLIAKGVNE